MQLNKTGYGNVAIGPFAGLGTNGSDNVAIGDRALANTTEGDFNTAVGYAALSYCTGYGNIGIGKVAGVKLTSGENNIDIGNQGLPDDSRTIRIGNLRTQQRAFIAGINGVTVADGVSVVVNSEGQLGTATSSARYKEAIEPMDKASEALLALKPVTFRYNKELDPDGIAQFGLVAEQVEKVNPKLVARDTEGKPYTVRYEAVNAMLLNEFLKEHRRVGELEAALAQQQKTIEALSAGLKEQAVQIQKVSAQLQTKDAETRLVSAGN